MRIINNVMKLQSGGEPKRVRYISAPGRNINRGIGDPDRVTSVGDEIAKAREWEANWYKGRKATGKFEDQLDDTTYNFMIDRITTVKDGEAIITANADPTYERQGALLTMKKGGSLVSDGRRFKFKDSPLVRNSRTLNKRDMRKKFMKSDRPTYSTNRVRKGQDGLQFVSYTPVETPDIPKFESSDVFSTYNIPIVRDESVVSQPKVDEPRIDEPIIESAVNTPMKRELFNIKPSKGLDEFNKWYDEVEKEDPEAKHYRQFLTKMAEQESGFNSAIQNRAGAPAYGYFQFMQDGKKYNNITAYAGTDIETFRNNPKLQIKAAIKLAKSFERGFNKKDLELAAQKGYTKFGLLGGAWLAGNGGVRKYLQGLANPSDRHWSKSGSGTDVASRIQMFNF